MSAVGTWLSSPSVLPLTARPVWTEWPEVSILILPLPQAHHVSDGKVYLVPVIETLTVSDSWNTLATGMISISGPNSLPHIAGFHSHRLGYTFFIRRGVAASFN